MRTAALGLWFGDDHDALISVVADISRLTHQDPRSVAGGVAIALAANILESDQAIDAHSLCGALADAIDNIHRELAGLFQELPGHLDSPDVKPFWHILATNHMNSRRR